MAARALMPRNAAASVLVALLCAAASVRGGDEASLPLATLVAPDVHVVAGSMQAASADNGGFVGNLGFIATPQGTVVVNAGGSYRLGRALLARAEQTTGRPVIALVLTQARPEFIMGAAAFSERGIDVIAHEGTARLIAQRCAECLRRLQRELGDDAMDGTRLVQPSRVIAQDLHLGPPGNGVQVLYPGRGQTVGDLVVVDERSGVAFTGALVSEGRIPEIEDAAGAAPWRRVLAVLGKRPLRAIVPGYGPPGPPARLIGATDAYLARLVSDVQTHWERGDDLLATEREVTLPAWRDWAQYEPLHARNVQRQYLAAEAEWAAAPAASAAR
jgi:glyoxylase-like metal-dependent hydrolase (beta-lactamase superfamily II)